MSISPIRDEASLADRRQVYHDAGRAAVWGLGVNVLLVMIKLVGGAAFGSAALLADAVNSIGDVASAIAVRVALLVAQRDEDDDHPYGHTKAESIAGLSVSLVVTLSAILLGMETLRSLTGANVHQVAPIAGWLAIGCAIIKETLYQYMSRTADRLRSSALGAAAWDHRSDALGSAAVGTALLASPLFGPVANYVDSAAALIVCGFLVFTGVRMFASVARELMDQQADEATIADIRRIASQVDAVAEVEKLRVRKSGLEYFAEIHVQVDGELTVSEGHRIGHSVKDRLLVAIPRLRDVHVHVEPFGG